MLELDAETAYKQGDNRDQALFGSLFDFPRFERADSFDFPRFERADLKKFHRQTDQAITLGAGGNAPEVGGRELRSAPYSPPRNHRGAAGRDAPSAVGRLQFRATVTTVRASHTLSRFTLPGHPVASPCANGAS